jgi:transposase
MIERHWDGIAAYLPSRKTRSRSASSRASTTKSASSSGRAYGLRDEEYLKLKILTASLPELSNHPNITH